MIEEICPTHSCLLQCTIYISAVPMYILILSAILHHFTYPGGQGI